MKLAVLIHKDEGSVHGVTVPALPGCFSWGDTMDDALENTREAVQAHLSTMVSEGMPISFVHANPEDFATDSGEEGGAMVDIDMSEFESALASVR
ncbi:type II toxin-antitoxin system HicB family antitoxin [Massilia sp. R2A-15]|uniref:type II toxin-antitoxin system HicB family antitoxin n=1 Tax=Massilia sp. R2A-15 TaxID=3064278 RepID=UPI002735240E|nr:type II toxin-antitoxin system HicB family antitoxin [Massilia sp. R2A-15]WLI87524.1 type II toxin-antitoxin system HicB family antitoxin [Massilia sp. R2A-15]